jgi:hypothetical protein
MMKVSKTVSIDLDLLQRVLEENPNFSKVVTEALYNWLLFKRETKNGNAIHFNKVFDTKISTNILWQMLTFDGIEKWDKMVHKIEYLTEFKTGLGTKCILYGKVRDIESISIAEITEYEENVRIVYRSQGDLRIFSSATLKPKGAKTEVAVVIVIGISDKLASPDINEEIKNNLESALASFEKIATTYP